MNSIGFKIGDILKLWNLIKVGEKILEGNCTKLIYKPSRVFRRSGAGGRS